jgi:hypothetical protein
MPSTVKIMLELLEFGGRNRAALYGLSSARIISNTRETKSL